MPVRFLFLFGLSPAMTAKGRETDEVDLWRRGVRLDVWGMTMVKRV
jgi:hypothetical protein